MSEEDTLHDVWQFSGNATAALESSPQELKNSLGCVVCNLLMLEPHTLQCGHSFCSKCLQSWLKQREESCTCPQCRAPITAEPVLSLGLRQIALAVVNSWNNKPGQRDRVPEEALVLHPVPDFLPFGPACVAQYDSDDEVYRCPHCHYEIEDSQCNNCGRTFSIDSDYGVAVDGEEYSERSQDSDSEELLSFIDDDSDQELGGGDDTVRSDINSLHTSMAEEMSDDDENSDDSLLDQVRQRSTVNLIDDDSSGDDENSDVQLVSIRHRPVIIDDDDDDDDS